MEEKKVNDEQIIRGLENWILHDCTAKQEDLVNALDLIKRLQGEKKELDESCELFKHFNEKHCETISEQKAEIERLTKNAKYWERKHCNAVREWEVEAYNRGLKIIELQKQVDELKEKLEIAEGTKNRLTIFDRIKIHDKAVKDTEKEIFEKIFEVLCCFSTQGKSKEYNEGYIQCLEEVDDRIQKLAKERGLEEV